MCAVEAGDVLALADEHRAARAESRAVMPLQAVIVKFPARQ